MASCANEKDTTPCIIVGCPQLGECLLGACVYQPQQRCVGAPLCDQAKNEYWAAATNTPMCNDMAFFDTFWCGIACGATIIVCGNQGAEQCPPNYSVGPDAPAAQCNGGGNGWTCTHN